MKADLVLTNANVLTMNPAQPQAEAIAVKNDKIIKVGAKEDIDPWIGKNTKVISLEGKTVVPGFIDTHIHVVDFARVLTWVDLNGTKSIGDLKNRIKKRSQHLPKEKWIIGRGWNQACFEEKRFPNRADLDEVSSDNPVVLYHQCEQICIVNSKALKLTGITNQTSPPKNSALDKADTGELTGILRGDATNLVWDKIPEPNEEDLLESTSLACEAILKAGITSVHWIVLLPIEIQILKKLYLENRLPIRVYLIIPESLVGNVTDSGLHETSGSMLKVGGALIFADGYLASRTAALLQPYSDDPAEKGKLLYAQEGMIKLADRIQKAGFQLVIHAVGDKALDTALTTIEETSSNKSEKVRRNRLEQAAVLNEELLKRMKKQQVIVSVQPRVIASEFSVWSAMERLGAERAKWLFPLKTLIGNGVMVVAGSDCPMEPLSPLLGIQAAVTRDAFPEERISVDDALRMYTVNSAYASFEESIKGSIEVGKLSDIAVLSCDPRVVPPDKIKDITVEMTILGGRVVYPKIRM